jgi:predicted transposase YbfD/YdcC
MKADFPFARSLLVVRSNRTVKKTGQGSTESRFYLSSLPPQDYTAGQWLALIREHWGGVEIRNHWRRDALMGEDRSRSRHPNLLANMALLRSALLTVVADHFDGRSWPQIREQLNSHPNQSLNLLCP